MAAFCHVCGRPLETDSATVCTRGQMVDIPLPIAAEITEHLQMQVKDRQNPFEVLRVIATLAGA